MKVTPLAIPGVILLEPKVFGDDRGFFFESLDQAKFEAAIGRHVTFVRGNHVWSDPNIGIRPIDGKPILSAKEQQGKSLAAAGHFA